MSAVGPRICSSHGAVSGVGLTPTDFWHTATAWISKEPRDRAMSDVAARVKKIVVEHLGVEADKVTDSASFIDDLGADSLDTVELVMAFEEEFNCEIPDDAAEQIQTVGDAVKFLEQHASAGTPPAAS